MLSLSEYQEYYDKHNKYPNDISIRSTKLQGIKLEKRYNKYCEMFKKKSTNCVKDLKWEKVKKEVFERDNGECQFIAFLETVSSEVLNGLRSQAKGMIRTIDPAHVFARSTHPYLKYDKDNIVCLNRYSHSMIDIMRSPLFGEPIDKAEHHDFWTAIIGIDRMEILEEKIKNHK